MAEAASAPNSSSDSLAHKSGFFRVPGLFVRLSTKGLLDSESIWSPTSPLDSKVFSVLGSTIVSSPRSPGPYWPQPKRLDLDCNRVGLRLVGSLNDESITASGSSRKLLLGPEMRVNVPSSKTHLHVEENSLQAPVNPCYELNQQESVLELTLSEPIDQYMPNSPHFPSSNSQPMLDDASDGFICNQSMNEITQSEEYTCVISRGPDPKTTHIFAIVVCCSCNEKLSEGKDIYIYLGEKAFCSPECREIFIMEEEPMRDTLSSSKPNYRGDCVFEPINN
uniref:FLZ-type domain-containing protein n=1 Tax=Ananas comosus var. bracteatus TaxID=296719 RepID=A0A6V7PTL8_ANACO|nr:unnamed protein product [Ananas comosus var. bracteatus]